MSGSLPLVRSAGLRLDGWKSIAQHLGRGCRTIQRWHALYQMPVHRVGGTGGGVFVYSDELEEWFRYSPERLECGSADNFRTSPVQIPAIACSVGGTRSSPIIVPMDPQPYRQAKALVDRAYGIWRIVSRNNLSTIARLFREAMDLDAGNAEAYAGLSQTLVAQGMIGSI